MSTKARLLASTFPRYSYIQPWRMATHQECTCEPQIPSKSSQHGQPPIDWSRAALFRPSQDMIKPGNIRRAGRFFEEIFAGTEFGEQCYVNSTPHQPCGDYYGGSDDTTRQALSSASTSVSISPGSEVYPQEVLEFERELAELYVNDEI